jgi:hypothetical protein
MVYVVSSPARVDDLIRDPEALARRAGADPLTAAHLASGQAKGLRLMAELIRTKWTMRIARFAPATLRLLTSEPTAEEALDEFLAEPLNRPYELAEIGFRLAAFVAARPEIFPPAVAELARFEILQYAIAQTDGPEREVRLERFTAPVEAVRRAVLTGEGATPADLAEVPAARQAFLFIRRDDARVRLIKLPPAAADLIERLAEPARPGSAGVRIPPGAFPVLHQMKIDVQAS